MQISALDIKNCLSGRYKFQDLVLEGTEGNSLLFAVHKYRLDSLTSADMTWYAVKYDPGLDILYHEDRAGKHWRLDNYNNTEERPFLNDLLRDACQINVFQLVKQYTTVEQMDQFCTSDGAGYVLWKDTTSIPNSATHFVGSRMASFSTLKYNLKTDISVILPHRALICNRLPNDVYNNVVRTIFGYDSKLINSEKTEVIKRKKRINWTRKS